MSGQWMPCEGTTDMAPIATLVNLQSLAMERLRDGEIKNYKCLESLTKLETLFVWGKTGAYGSTKKKGQDFPPADEHTLDLSNLTKLNSFIWIEASFGTVSELNAAWQNCKVGEEYCLEGMSALVFPPNPARVAFQEMYGFKISDALKGTTLESLGGKHVEVFEDTYRGLFAGDTWMKEKVSNSTGTEQDGQPTHPPPSISTQ
jgi:hypothetical protein